MCNGQSSVEVEAVPFVEIEPLASEVLGRMSFGLLEQHPEEKNTVLGDETDDGQHGRRTDVEEEGRHCWHCYHYSCPPPGRQAGRPGSRKSQMDRAYFKTRVLIMWIDDKL